MPGLSPEWTHLSPYSAVGSLDQVTRIHVWCRVNAPSEVKRVFTQGTGYKLVSDQGEFIGLHGFGGSLVGYVRAGQIW